MKLEGELASGGDGSDQGDQGDRCSEGGGEIDEIREARGMCRVLRRYEIGGMDRVALCV
jgi:hypothetical protein